MKKRKIVGIKVTKTPNWGKYRKRIKNADTKLYSIAESIIVGIIKRTQSGRDRNKKAFRGYSKAYSKTGTVNLTETGTMLHAIDRKKIAGGVRLHFPNSNESTKAFGNQVTYKRKFFGLDKAQKEMLKQKLGKYIVKTTR